MDTAKQKASAISHLDLCLVMSICIDMCFPLFTYMKGQSYLPFSMTLRTRDFLANEALPTPLSQTHMIVEKLKFSRLTTAGSYLSRSGRMWEP
ncbi:hypothetical protein BOO88_25895 [Stutzerimonas stutzeri]|nr:hypothetical protein BOO89_20775 [Stutzerimonas stutzeri]AZO92169.1 hypothetical protein BOO88_25895 [Stutzerimonas stutzeri]